MASQEWLIGIFINDRIIVLETASLTFVVHTAIAKHILRYSNEHSFIIIWIQSKVTIGEWHMVVVNQQNTIASNL